jgi:hypothetical protein
MKPLASDQHARSDVLGFIRDREVDLSRSQRKIGRAILGDPKSFVEKPIEELVAWLGVSAPTITRQHARQSALSRACDTARDPRRSR